MPFVTRLEECLEPTGSVEMFTRGFRKFSFAHTHRLGLVGLELGTT